MVAGILSNGARVVDLCQVLVAKLTVGKAPIGQHPSVILVRHHRKHLLRICDPACIGQFAQRLIKPIGIK